MILNFFFDVDGTLLPFGKGLPESALEAIKKITHAGHRIFLCTGRSRREIDKRLLFLPFSGGVFSAGCSAYIGERMVVSHFLTREERDRVREYAQKKDFFLQEQTLSGTYMTEKGFEYFNTLLKEEIGETIDIPGLFIREEFPIDSQVTKYTVMSARGNMNTLRRDLSSTFFIVDNTVGVDQNKMAEITLPGINKGTGIKAIIESLGERRESVVALGDGTNDIEAIEYAGLGIAMGNASFDLKQRADYITDDVERDGLKKAIDYALEVYLKRGEGI